MQPVERQRLVLDVVGVGELGVDRDQIVDARGLDAVAGIIDHRDVGVARQGGEIAHGALHLHDAEIVALVDHVEFRALQQRRDRVGVVERVGEQAGVLVFGVADDQRDAARREGFARRRTAASAQAGERPSRPQAQPVQRK